MRDFAQLCIRAVIGIADGFSRARNRFHSTARVVIGIACAIALAIGGTVQSSVFQVVTIGCCIPVLIGFCSPGGASTPPGTVLLQAVTYSNKVLSVGKHRRSDTTALVRNIPATFIRFRVFQQCTLHLQKSILIGLCCLLYLCFSITKSQEINCLLYF